MKIKAATKDLNIKRFVGDVTITLWSCADYTGAPWNSIGDTQGVLFIIEVYSTPRKDPKNNREERKVTIVRLRDREQAMKLYKSDLVLLLPPGVTEL